MVVWSSWKDLNWIEDLMNVVLIWPLVPGQLLTKSAQVWKELPFVGHLYMPLCLAELSCIVAIYIYWVFSQLPCCTWLVPELKLNDGWPVLSHSSIVYRNHCHKVGLDHKLKYQSALLFSFLFEIFFALACVSMSVVMWYATQPWVALGGLPPWRKKEGLLAAHQSPSRLDSYTLVKRTDQLLGGQSASLTDGPECGQPAKYIHTCRCR